MAPTAARRPMKGINRGCMYFTESQSAASQMNCLKFRATARMSISIRVGRGLTSALHAENVSLCSRSLEFSFQKGRRAAGGRNNAVMLSESQ